MTNRISLSIIFIFLCLFILTVGQSTPIEISSGVMSFIIYATILIALPIVLYKQTKHFYHKCNSIISRITTTVIIVLLFGPGTIYILLVYFGKFMCTNITDKTLFTKQDIFNSSIVVRHYDCGAHDTSFPNAETVAVRNVFGLLNFVTKSDTTSIDKSKWRRTSERQNDTQP